MATYSSSPPRFPRVPLSLGAEVGKLPHPVVRGAREPKWPLVSAAEVAESSESQAPSLLSEVLQSYYRLHSSIHESSQGGRTTFRYDGRVYESQDFTDERAFAPGSRLLHGAATDLFVTPALALKSTMTPNQLMENRTMRSPKYRLVAGAEAPDAPKTINANQNVGDPKYPIFKSAKLPETSKRTGREPKGPHLACQELRGPKWPPQHGVEAPKQPIASQLARDPKYPLIKSAKLPKTSKRARRDPMYPLNLGAKLPDTAKPTGRDPKYPGALEAPKQSNASPRTRNPKYPLNQSAKLPESLRRFTLTHLRPLPTPPGSDGGSARDPAYPLSRTTT